VLRFVVAEIPLNTADESFWTAQIMFPNTHDLPTRFSQLSYYFKVALPISG
jgi:hypothetical protein